MDNSVDMAVSSRPGDAVVSVLYDAARGRAAVDTYLPTALVDRCVGHVLRCRSACLCLLRWRTGRRFCCRRVGGARWRLLRFCSSWRSTSNGGWRPASRRRRPRCSPRSIEFPPRSEIWTPGSSRAAELAVAKQRDGTANFLQSFQDRWGPDATPRPIQSGVSLVESPHCDNDRDVVRWFRSWQDRAF